MSHDLRVTPWTYRPALDGVRMLAVVLIVLFHAGVAGAENLFIGVDLFFVLSGFLVTNVIMSEIDAEGSLRLSRFWARRVRRLLPAAVLTVVLTCLVFVLVASLPERLDFVRQAQAALLYVANWQFILEARDYFATDAEHSPFMHFWSLSVEEQFYLFFPLLVLLVHRVAPRREKVMVATFLTVAGVSLASQVVSARHDPTRAYFATDARLYQLMAGAVAALVLRGLVRRGGGAERWSRSGGVLAGAGLVGLAVVGMQALTLSVSSVGMVATVFSLALVTGLYAAPASVPARAFSRPAPVYLGKISYGIYLFHYPVILVLEQVLTVRPLVVAAMGGVLAAALAALSYQLVETPIRQSRLLDAFRWRTVATGLMVSVVAAGLVVGPVLTSERSPAVAAATPGSQLQGAHGGAWMKRPVPAGLDFAALSEAKGPDERWCTAERADDCVVVEGGDPHVMLVGDSHARMLAAGFIPLAREKGFTLSTDIVLSCPWQLGVVNGTASPGSVESCKKSRSDLLATIKRLDVDVVVLSSLARSDVDAWQDKLVGLDGKPAPLLEMLYDGTVRTVRMIESTGAKVVIVKSILGTVGYDKDGWDPLDCLARAKHLGDCAVLASVDVPVVDGYYESLAVGNSDVATVDLDTVICPSAQVCAPVRRGQVVWRNHTHLTSGFVRMVREEIWDKVEKTGFVPAG